MGTQGAVRGVPIFCNRPTIPCHIRPPRSQRKKRCQTIHRHHLLPHHHHPLLPPPLPPPPPPPPTPHHPPPTTSTNTTTTTISTIQRGNIREQPTNQVSSSDNATSSAEKEMIEARLTSPCGKPYLAHNYCYCAPNSCSTISLTPREPANFKRFSSGCKWSDRQTNPTVQERTGRSAIILRPHPRTHGELAARRRPIAAGDDRRCRPR